MPAALTLHCEATGAAWRVWPDPEPVPPGAVAETGSYLFELSGHGAAANADLLLDEVTLEALRSPAGSARWRWRPGFHAGEVELELRLPGDGVRRLQIITDPDQRKLTRSDFDAMIREILEDTFALFSLSPFRRAVARGASTTSPAIARLEFLRSRIAELEDVVDRIARSPRRRLGAEETVQLYHRAHRATGPEIIRSLQHGRVLSESGMRPTLPPQLQGRLPQRIRIRRRQDTIDIPEHRQMAACLRSWRSWLQSVAEALARDRANSGPDTQATAAAWSRRCLVLARQIGVLIMAEPFKDASPVPATLTLSALFRNDPDYRRFYRIWQDLNLGIASVFGDFLNLPLARTFELYELWCFLRLVRAATEEWGSESLTAGDLFIVSSDGALTIASGAVTVGVGNGWRLCFQKRYREFWNEADGRGSYTRNMTPDMVAYQDCDGTIGQLIVIDAKYRINEGLNDALSSVHTYRDALVSEGAQGISSVVRAAYLVTPQPPCFKESYRDTPMPGRLFHPQYRSEFRFGAVTLRPGMTATELRQALATIVADSAERI